MNDEVRLEIQCPDCGKKLMVLRIAGTRLVQSAPILERQDDRRAFSLGEIAEKCGVSYSAILRTPCQGKIKVLKASGEGW
jgi:hypothetical protein